MCPTPYKVWTEATGYHFRWKSETGFSDFKETLTATSVRGGHGPGGNGEDGGLQRVQEGEGGDNEGHRERGEGGLTRRRRGRARPFIVSDLSNRV